MSSYSADEIKKFEEKDERISKQGLVQALITSGLFTKEEVIGATLLCSIVDDYRNWLNTGDLIPNKKKICTEKDLTWKDIAKDNNLPIPTVQQETLLENIVDKLERRTSTDDVICLGKLMAQIITKFGKYPTQEKSVQIVVDSIPLETILD